MNGLRLGAVAVSAEVMHRLLCTSPPGEWLRVERGLPADAEYVRSYYDDERNCFVFVYTHPSFDLTPPGHLVGMVPPPCLTRIYIPGAHE